MAKCEEIAESFDFFWSLFYEKQSIIMTLCFASYNIYIITNGPV